MDRGYHIDAEQISLKEFEQSLTKRELIPARTVLKENLKDNFLLLDKQGIKTLGSLIKQLKNKKRFEELHEVTGIDLNYLTQLKRESGSYLPNPVALEKFPGADMETVHLLKEAGIKNSRHLFNLNKEEREALPGNKKSIEELFCLSDLTRIYGVGPVFARIFYDINLLSVGAFLKREPAEIVRIYEETRGEKAGFTVKDIEFAREVAQFLELKD